MNIYDLIRLSSIERAFHHPFWTGYQGETADQPTDETDEANEAEPEAEAEAADALEND